MEGALGQWSIDRLLMSEIPGKDNEIGDLTDDALGSTAKKYGSPGPVNMAFYHSWFSGGKDAMGSNLQHRGYADENLYMAMTSQGKVAPMSGWSGSKDGKTVHADGRDGSHSLDKAYNGTNNNKFFRTPASFFTDDNGSGDKADTSSGITWVLNKTGDMHDVIASGTRILLPDIPGVGALRVRYPIMPTHAEGSATWKELDAASTPKDIQKDVLLL